MGSQVGGVIQMGKKIEKSFCCWFVFPDGTSVQWSLWCGYKHMALAQGGSWYRGENKCLERKWVWGCWSSPGTGDDATNCYPNTEDVAITGVWRCVSELTFFPASWDMLHWFHWRYAYGSIRESILWRADLGWSSTCCVWNFANKGEGATGVLVMSL